MRRRRWAGAVALTVVLLMIAVGCRPAFDFDGDKKADKVFVDGKTGLFYRLNPSPTPPTALSDHYGMWVPGDYDNNTIWDPATTIGDEWWSSTTGTQTWAQPPTTLGDFVLVVPGNYDGDGRTVPAYYREDGTWFIKGHTPQVFGSPRTNPSGNAADSNDQDFPVPADYDGDHTTDLAVYNPRAAVWRVRSSKTGAISSSVVGTPGAFPAPADYDGDGKDDRAVVGWNGEWTIEGQGSFTFGVPPSSVDWFPSVADYDGDSKADPSYAELPTNAGTTVWHIRPSSDPLNPTIDLIPASATPSGWAVPAQVRFDLMVAVVRFKNVVACLHDAAQC